MTLPTLAPLEFSELGAPRATNTMDLGSDRMTVDMYSQNAIPVHAKRGFAKSALSVIAQNQEHMNLRGGTILYRITNTPLNPASLVTLAIAAHFIF